MRCATRCFLCLNKVFRRSFPPFAGCGPAVWKQKQRAGGARDEEEVGLKSIWQKTYSNEPEGVRCISARCSPAFSRLQVGGLTAKALSQLSPNTWPVKPLRRTGRRFLCPALKALLQDVPDPTLDPGGLRAPLLVWFLRITAGWRGLFAQRRSFERALAPGPRWSALPGSAHPFAHSLYPKEKWNHRSEQRKQRINGMEGLAVSPEKQAHNASEPKSNILSLRYLCCLLFSLHSRCSWEPQALFDPILKEALLLCHGRLVPMAMDDTGLREARAADPCASLSLRPHRIENAKAAGSTIGSRPIC